MENHIDQIVGNSNFSSNLYPTNTNYNLNSGYYPIVSYIYSKDNFTVDIYILGFKREEVKMVVKDYILYIQDHNHNSYPCKDIKLSKYVKSEEFFFQTLKKDIWESYSL